MDNFQLPKQLLWEERLDGWRYPFNAPKKQLKIQVAADVSTHLPRRLFCESVTLDDGTTAERGAWRGLLYDITGINQRRDHSSERVGYIGYIQFPDETSVVGQVPIESDWKLRPPV